MSEKAARERDTRISRALRDVVPHYNIMAIASTSDDAKIVRFRVRAKLSEKALSDYTVSVSREWKKEPTCTCPDGERQLRLRGYCKHAIAVLLSTKEYSCQLLELFLREI